MRLADSTVVKVAHYPSSFSGIIRHRCVIFLLAMACILPARIRAQESSETVAILKVLSNFFSRSGRVAWSFAFWPSLRLRSPAKR